MIAFSGNPLDRASERRGDAAWLTERRADSATRVLPLWKLQPLLLGPEDASGTTTGLGFLDGDLAAGLGSPQAVEVFLGMDGGIAYFARDISSLADPLAASLASHGHFRDARSAASLLPAHEIAMLGQLHRGVNPVISCTCTYADADQRSVAPGRGHAATP